MFEILKRIQSDISGLKTDVSTLKSDISDVKGRIEHLEVLARKQRRDSAAMLVMMRGTVGIFDEPLSDLEEDVPLVVRIS